MSGKVCLSLAVVTLLSATTCFAQPGVVVIRGQNPAPAEKPVPAPAAAVSAEAYGPLIGSAPGYGEYKKANSKKDFKTYPQFVDQNYGYEGGYYSGPEGYHGSTGVNRNTYMAGGGDGCPYCQYGNSCPPSGCKHCGCCKHKKNHHTYEYKWPQNMVYPPDVMPAGMVQYPYYTLRGPTDFFMK